MPPKNIQPHVPLTSIDGCECVHIASEPVHEVFQGQTAWQGTVEVFDMSAIRERSAFTRGSMKMMMGKPRL
jgi:hypothetical protein